MDNNYEKLYVEKTNFFLLIVVLIFQTIDNAFRDNIDVLILNLQKYGDVIAPCINKSNSLKKKLMFRKLMNPNSCKK